MKEIVLILMGFTIGMIIGYKWGETHFKKYMAYELTKSTIWIKDYLDAFPGTSVQTVIRKYREELIQQDKENKK